MALGHWAVEYLGEGNGQSGSGGGGGAVWLTVTKSEYSNRTEYKLNKTWKEIKDALAEGTQMMLYGEGTGEASGVYAQFAVGGVGVHDGIYTVLTGNPAQGWSYEYVVLGVEGSFTTTSSEDGYPMVTIYDGNAGN